MFKVNDYVVYGLTGVCQIADIRKDKRGNSDETEYYVLQPVYSNNMTIMVPINNPNIMMRAISTKDDVLSLIAAMSEIEPVWADDDKQRTNDYKVALKTGKPEEWAKIIKTLSLEKEARSAIGKKLTKAEEDIFNAAEKYLNEEIAVVMNISPDEVASYIFKHIH